MKSSAPSSHRFSLPVMADVGGHNVPLPSRFEDFSWHDNAVHGFRVIEGPDGCSGELVLDIDYLVEWLPPKAKGDGFEFRIAPADLIFHEATDLVISVDYAGSSAALGPMSIHQVHREVITYQNGSSSFAWKIEMNWPTNAFISFQSTGFTQALRAEPVVSGIQRLLPSQRTP